jgi:FAD synthase
MTFEPHPREFFAPRDAPARLSPLREKIEQLSAQDFAAVAPKLGQTFISSLNAQAAVEKRSNSGGSSLDQARRGIAALRARLQG